MKLSLNANSKHSKRTNFVDIQVQDFWICLSRGAPAYIATSKSEQGKEETATTSRLLTESMTCCCTSATSHLSLCWVSQGSSRIQAYPGTKAICLGSRLSNVHEAANVAMEARHGQVETTGSNRQQAPLLLFAAQALWLETSYGIENLFPPVLTVSTCISAKHYQQTRTIVACKGSSCTNSGISWNVLLTLPVFSLGTRRESESVPSPSKHQDIQQDFCHLAACKQVTC